MTKLNFGLTFSIFSNKIVVYNLKTQFNVIFKFIAFSRDKLCFYIEPSIKN